MRRAKTPRHERGFSLVETIAAMGILALAAIPLLQISTEATRNTASLEARLLARSVGENVLNRAIASPIKPDAGLQSGTATQMGRVFGYSLAVSPPDASGLKGLEVLVYPEGDEGAVLARLVTVIAIERALPAVEPKTPEEGGQ